MEPFYGAVLDLEVGDDPAEGIEDGVEDQGLERPLRVAFRRRDLLHDGVQDGRHAFARAGGDLEDLFGFAPDEVADLVGHDLDLGGLHVDLVEDRDDLQAVVDGHV